MNEIMMNDTKTYKVEGALPNRECVVEKTYKYE